VDEQAAYGSACTHFISFSCQCKYYDSKPYMQNNNLLKKKKKVPSKALIITKKQCYIAHINICYGNPPIETSSLDCLAAGRRLPYLLCLAQQGGGSLVFPPSPLPTSSTPFPVLTAQKATTLPKLPLPKKDKLKEKEQVVGEKHLLNFGKSIRQIEQWLNVHKYRAHSSYFPSQIVSSLLDRFSVALGITTRVMEALSSTKSLWSRQSYWLNKIKHEKSWQLSNVKNERSQGSLTLRMKMSTAPSCSTLGPPNNLLTTLLEKNMKMNP
jgi:hypothetical protein